MIIIVVILIIVSFGITWLFLAEASHNKYGQKIDDEEQMKACSRMKKIHRKK